MATSSSSSTQAAHSRCRSTSYADWSRSEIQAQLRRPRRSPALLGIRVRLHARVGRSQRRHGSLGTDDLMAFDSRIDTYAHIGRVRALLNEVVVELLAR